jgi:hypothetical protein
MATFPTFAAPGYPSVRRPGGTCIACFRPALIYHPRRGADYRLTFDAGDETIESEVIPHA